ncbi:MAG: hypothetical protein GY851_30090 [bacterium]|nr:hypothetical protein [bacterium]
MALLLVLWVMMVLCTVALQMHFAAHLRLNVTAGTGDAAKALYLARAGVELAVSDLMDVEKGVVSLQDLSDSVDHTYREVELGEGVFTLYAGPDERGEPRCGILDECSKLNINTVETDVLSRLQGMEPETAKAIIEMRPEDGYWDLDDVAVLEQVDLVVLYGEDQNRNGLLDAGEDDGEESWPPDNADGTLDQGLSAYLTTRSATRNVTAEGGERAKLGEASVDELTQSVQGLTQQEADSIVAHRKSGKFESIADLLDVELVERVKQDGQNDQNQQQEQTEPNAQQQQQQQAKDQAEKDQKDQGEDEQSQKKDSKEPKDDEKGSEKEEEKPQNGGDQQVQTKGTGKKAFDAERVKAIAGYVTASEDEVSTGLVNINTAPYEVLAALPGMDETHATTLLQERGTRDEPFASVADLLDVQGITDDIFKKVCPHVTVRSDVFAVRSFGVLNNTLMCRGVYAVIDRTEETVRIARWRDLE